MPNNTTRFKLLITYNGQKYYGWQKQKNTELPTIQGTIEQTLQTLFQKEIPIVGAGRTDAGVHALKQIAHFDILESVTKRLSLQKALNALLPNDICIQQIWKAPPTFHALHSCTGKYYIYRILNHPLPSVFRQKQIYWYPYPVNIEKLRKMSTIIKGKHDFKSFQNRGTPVKTTVRTIYFADWSINKQNILSFHVRGEGFLKQMIRNVVGTQLALLMQAHPINQFQQILLAKDRKIALKTAPACGLYLYKVFYPITLDKKCEKI